ncbi:hypothetical protein P7K49_005543 [Saguinus oedipus]|uniref:Uncharacterized protein n=1 Tax=Saguinus oedipus TaxID=9490 RepID=A0ABQ9VZV4_SAGOE|nr:hypothetical protein P7K49_005543 [Saguinus oedipus]
MGVEDEEEKNEESTIVKTVKFQGSRRKKRATRGERSSGQKNRNSHITEPRSKEEWPQQEDRKDEKADEEDSGRAQECGLDG